MTNYEYTPAHEQLIHQMLRAIVQHDGSDLHLREGEPPFMRHHGHLTHVPDFTPVTRDDLAGIIGALTTYRQNLRGSFEEAGEADLSYELEGTARFRVNIFKERMRLALTLRVIPSEVPHIDKIGVPVSVRNLAMEHHGLVLVTGATGSGKTTTLAAMIDHRNRSSAGHILTIEDPIEIVHPNHKSIISQREVGSDTADFGQALRRALRQDPDVILIGEIRDEETMRTALAAAETGHLVLATLHTIDAQETIMRILDLFPSEAESQARAMLAGALKGIVSQRLARTTDGKRTAVVEVLINTARIADAITNPDETGKITEMVSEGEYYGMQTFDQALIGLIMNGRISEEEASHLTTSPQNFKLSLEAAKAQAEVDARRAAAQQQHAQVMHGAPAGHPGTATPQPPSGAPVAPQPPSAPVPMGAPHGAPPAAMPVPAGQALHTPPGAAPAMPPVPGSHASPQPQPAGHPVPMPPAPGAAPAMPPAAMPAPPPPGNAQAA